ncbi:SDR family NAD(P)-dependent oxidoreductase [Salinicoccus halitifaciens]|uniref:3-oxoacyl-[acyl-carrier-protein] reductase FabG n=1 Tax=Salinicoccus halitifaciens TaxID=1073415 RepID=A0ABV2EB02_9STAP|nr:SDR family NAD(P)-dependent oxidoreductase [Salinicoccus halitifaciens]MCD2137545.1 SDR family oxidoreductase [Salinicoccus halitifaciens]
MDFEGKVALITGGGSEKGIGRATALKLSERGATVILADVNGEGAKKVAEGIKKDGGNAIGITIDVTDYKQVNETVKQLKDEHGKIDILVNNAGISRPTRVLDITEDEWDLVFDINMKGLFFVTQAVLKSMKEEKYGRVINLSSVSGKRGGGIFGGSHYSAAKAGVTGFTKAIAREMAEFNITCNTVAPGLVGGTNITGGLLTEEAEKEIIKSIPLKRVGSVDDIAYSIAFLASEEAGYITGEELDINGGSHID